MSDNKQQEAEPLQDPYTFNLLKIIKLADDVSYETLTLTEPTAGQVEEAAKASTGIGSNIILISLVGKIPEAAVRKMGYRDFDKARKYLINFTEGGPETGEKS